MTDQLPEYNGWTNKPTWLFNLYFSVDNDEYWLEQAAELLKDEDLEREVKFELADNMRDYFEDIKYENMDDGANFFDDLMEFAFAYINWDELAGHVIEQAEENM